MQASVRMEQRHAVQFMARLGRTASETHQLLSTAYQEDSLRKPATRTYHNRFHTMGISVYGQSPKMRKNRTRRNRKTRYSSIIKVEDKVKQNNLGSDAESNVSEDSSNDSFIGFKLCNNSNTGRKNSNNSFCESNFNIQLTRSNNEKSNFVKNQTNYHTDQTDLYTEQCHFGNEPSDYNYEFPLDNRNDSGIKGNNKIFFHNKQTTESDIHKNNLKYSNTYSNNVEEDTTLGSTMLENCQHESNIEENTDPNTEGAAMINMNMKYESNMAENNDHDTVVAVMENTMQTNAIMEKVMSDNDNQERNVRVNNETDTVVAVMENTMQTNAIIERVMSDNDNQGKKCKSKQ
ncbi:unnamed protein product [Meganyctiphanes norvegica]|uniref:Uncharacterized protein n=1 Tax=Meganyctiphanes norvegica TaxID=48144 RepID=A0AAV2QGU9_MEGNR